MDQALKEIEKAIKAGKKSEHFNKVLDELLGITEVKDSPELNEIWEKNKG